MPDRGDKRAFVRANLRLSDAEIAAAAPRSLGLTPKKVYQHRKAIGYIDGTRTKRTRKKGEREKGERARREAMKRKAKQRPTRAANGHATNGHTETSPKEAQLRRLIFELGFDAARHVWDEFERAHRGMTERDGDES